ncbi:MAG: c-type cytochrome [Isosphaeraceae bacterium]
MPTMRTKLRRDDVKTIVWLVQDSQGGESQTLRERAMENSGRARAPVVARAAKRTSEPVDRATSWPGVNTPDRGRGLFLRFCVSCHGADGSSRPVRSRVPWAPDFTSTDWQGNIDEHKMKFAILEGYGTQMPAFDTRLSEPQVGDLVAFVRTFAPTRRKSGQGEQEGPDLVSFNERFLRFQEELNDLQRQYRELSDVPPGKALSESSGSRQHEPSPQLPRGVPATPAIVELFQKRCVKCHGADGTGNEARDRMAEIPDFTRASWQAQRSDPQLLASILNGKGDDMPPVRGKISEEQARGLVAYVRAFAPTVKKSSQAKRAGAAQVGTTEVKPWRGLFATRLVSMPIVSDMQAGSFKSPQRPATRNSDPSAPSTPAIRALFQKRCVKCHGADGTGNEARDRMAEIPDFTDASWHARRSDPQLLASILNGKGDDMPPVRGKISEEQARGLVAYLRTFAPTMDKSTQEEQEEAATVGSAGIKPPRGFFKKLIRWFGKFHPPSVHFPIALLTAAVVAEFLRIRTGKPAFDVILRYCLWFGTITALVSGVLGWFLGGFRLTDPSWVMLTHRWLGTSTVVCAVLVLMLCEVRCRLEHRQTGLWFRVPLIVLAVLVSATGFFGGAMVFGLNHYNWPP